MFPTLLPFFSFLFVHCWIQILPPCIMYIRDTKEYEKASDVLLTHIL